jgi:hypothetical protein
MASIPPALVSLSPSASPAVGGVRMTLTTQGFTGDLTLQFARQPVFAGGNITAAYLNLTAPVPINVSADTDVPFYFRQLKVSFDTLPFATPRSAYRYDCVCVWVGVRLVRVKSVGNERLLCWMLLLGCEQCDGVVCDAGRRFGAVCVASSVAFVL